MNQELHNKYCPRCGATEDLMMYTRRKNLKGVTVFYYICRPCNAERRRKWYNSGHQQQAVDNNRTYRHKKQTLRRGNKK